MKILGGFLLRKQAKHSGEKVIPSPISRGKIKKSGRGFTLIEVIIAMAILLIIVVSVLMLATVSAASLKDSEARDMAKNIATYTVEYLRSRNVTYPDNPLGHVFSPDPLLSEFGNDSSHNFPGLEDLGANPLLTNPMPLKPNSSSDTINIHPALPSGSYNTNTTSFYSSLQGFVSLADSPADSDPSSEDGNAKVVSGKYYDLTTGAPYVVRFPLTSTNPIKNFTALSGYNKLIYTTDTDKTNTSSPKYDSHYTNDSGKKAGAMAYRGFRVLTQIAARKKSSSDPDHVQYYDVKVTVFWTIGNYEHSYNLATQIITYGGT